MVIQVYLEAPDYDKPLTVGNPTIGRAIFSHANAMSINVLQLGQPIILTQPQHTT